ncbi:MAG: sigma 54-interacting transcriptional regulator [Magnetococcales bacterium]|nr:sigma 54-interacting transcriptional regulator [Magnetococcales bacterium]
MSEQPDSQNLLNCHPEPALLLDRAFRILAANRPYLENYGGNKTGAVIGAFCFATSHHLDQPCAHHNHPCPLARAAETGVPQRALHIHHTRRGALYVHVEILPIVGDDGAIGPFVEIIRPITFASPQPSATGLVGSSPTFVTMLDMIHRVAPKPFPVLLLGETGTGKELVARAIHGASRQSKGPFVPVECSELAENLFESELFGHKRGAFTGAVADKPGLLETAHGGTLFLDEVGEIPLQQQVKLLRALETLSFRQVGETKSRLVDFRLISATNQDLKGMMDAGTFRPDLYYRISAFPIQLPPLRERVSDIPLVACSLLERITLDKRVTLSQAAAALLKHYPFPGNVRELQNMLERAFLLSGGGLLLPEHFPDISPNGSPPLPQPENQLTQTPAEEEPILSLKEVEQRYLIQALARYPNDRQALADQLGISLRTLFRKLEALPSSLRNGDPKQ